ncbi:MAG: hypothetical protein QM696_03265 [Steroidobacteraceae bacterium]
MAKAPPPAPPAGTLPGGLKPVASVIDLMHYFVDPLSAQLWGAVGGDTNPKTDEDWEALRAKAVMLMEASNLLVTEGRPVGHPGQKLINPSGDGDYTPDQANEAVEKERAAFNAFALALQSATGELLPTIDKHDADAFLNAGGAIDEACENCHLRFWYPNSAKPAG